MPTLNIQGIDTEVNDGNHLLDILRAMEQDAIPKVIEESRACQKQDLRDAVIVISGAAQGIGRSIAAALAHQPIKALIILDIDKQGIENTAHELKDAGPVIMTYDVDLRDEARVRGIMEQVAKEQGTLTHSVSNAAILISGPLMEFSYSDFMRVMEINAGGHYNLVRESAREMLKHGKGTIAQVTSKSAFKGSSANHAYPASKAACNYFNQGVMFEHGDRIRINAAAFGNFLYSPLWTHREKGLFVQYSRNQDVDIFDIFKKYAWQSPDGKFCEYSDASQTITYLLSEESASLNGQTLRCDHGYTHW